MKTKRGFDLILTAGEHTSVKTLTAELYVKWYTLFIYEPGKEPQEFLYDELEPYTPMLQSTYVDHVPNPLAIEAFAVATGITVDPVFFEVAMGRWVLEVVRHIQR